MCLTGVSKRSRRRFDVMEPKSPVFPAGSPPPPGTRFTASEIAALKANESVSRVTPTYVAFTDDFKRYAAAMSLRGYPARQIFKACGIDPDVIGDDRMARSVSLWVQTELSVSDRVSAKIEGFSSKFDSVTGREKLADHDLEPSEDAEDRLRRNEVEAHVLRKRLSELEKECKWLKRSIKLSRKY